MNKGNWFLNMDQASQNVMVIIKHNINFATIKLSSTHIYYWSCIDLHIDICYSSQSCTCNNDSNDFLFYPLSKDWFGHREHIAPWHYAYTTYAYIYELMYIYMLLILMISKDWFGHWELKWMIMTILELAFPTLYKF